MLLTRQGRRQMTKMQTNEQRAAGYRELQAEFEAAGKTALAEKAAKRAVGFERQNIATPTNNLEDAITAEAQDWAEFFEVNDPQHLEARKLVNRANAACGYFEPLKGYYRGA